MEVSTVAIFLVGVVVKNFAEIVAEELKL
uniref:Uncharacterized protein n=1 Tax=Arundo donax TaxID=35708 RepID=A0A0A9AXK3_ARUDO